MNLSRPVLDEMIAHARESQPSECCGILLGFETEIVRAVRARNLSTNPNRYEVDPKDHIAARRIGRASDLDVVGFYHSHPHSPPEPSPTDLAEATYPDALYLIVGRSGDAWEARLFILEGGRATAVDLQVY